MSHKMTPLSVLLAVVVIKGGTSALKELLSPFFKMTHNLTKLLLSFYALMPSVTQNFM